MDRTLKQLLIISLLTFICCSSYAQIISKEYIGETYSFTYELKYKTALDSLNALILLTPEKSELYYYRAWCHFNNGKIGSAYDDVDKFIKTSKNKFPYNANVLMGKIHFKRMTPSLAISSFDKAISIDDKRVGAYLEKSKLYAYQKNHEAGIPFINRTIKKFPNEDELHLYRGLLYMYINNSKKALIDFQVILNSQQVQDTSKLSEAYFGIAKSNLNKKDYDKALEQVNKGLDLAPTYIVGYGLLGEIKYYQQDYNGALVAFNKFEERMQSDYYWNMIGECYEYQGDIESACAYYSKKCNMFRNDTKSCSKVRKLKCKN